MKATVKCSNCGAEITNLNFSWGKKQWIFMLPLLVILPLSLWPMWRIMKPKGDFREDLHVTVEETREVDNTLEILGTIENKGKATWAGIQIDVEFFDAQGKFIDEASGHVVSSVVAGEKENFKLDVPAASRQIEQEGIRMEVKVADARATIF